MHANDLGEALKMIMAARGWTQTRLGDELGKDQPWVSKVIGGRKDPRMRDAAAFLAKLGWEIRITPMSDGERAEDDPVKRREFVAGAAGTASAFFVPAPTTTPFHDPSFVRRLTRKAAYARHQVGANPVAETLVRRAGKIRAAATSGGRELQSAASEFMLQGSYVLRQSGRSDLSVRFASDALRLAEAAENPDDIARACAALGRMSIYPDCSRGPIRPDASRRTLQYARRGLDVPGISDYSRASLTSILACGLASVPGHERRARGALTRALNVDTLSTMDRAQILSNANDAFREIHEPREALKALDEAIDLSAHHSHWYHAVSLGDQIMIVLEMGDLEHAAFLMNELSETVPLVDSAVLDRYVEQISQAARPWSGVREVREARERLESVRSAG